ncbi:MAG: hypothetical protein ACT4OS_07690 [Acidimicrobiales bacterium]
MSRWLDGRQRHLLPGPAATMLGAGGQARITEASGRSRSTMIAGMKELAAGPGP